MVNEQPFVSVSIRWQVSWCVDVLNVHVAVSFADTSPFRVVTSLYAVAYVRQCGPVGGPGARERRSASAAATSARAWVRSAGSTCVPRRDARSRSAFTRRRIVFLRTRPAFAALPELARAVACNSRAHARAT